MRLEELLVKLGIVPQEQIVQSIAEQQRLQEAGVDEWLGQILLRNGFVHPDQLAVVLAEQPLMHVI